MNKPKNMERVYKDKQFFTNKMLKGKGSMVFRDFRKKSLSPKSKAKQIEKNFGRFARAFVLLRSKEKLTTPRQSTTMLLGPDDGSPLSTVRSELDMTVKTETQEREAAAEKRQTKVVSFDSRKSGQTIKSNELRIHMATPREIRESMPVCYRLKKWPYFVDGRRMKKIAMLTDEMELLVEDWNLEEEDDDHTWAHTVGVKNPSKEINRHHSLAAQYKLPIYKKKGSNKRLGSKVAMNIGDESIVIFDKHSKHMAPRISSISDDMVDKVIFDSFLGHYCIVPRDKDFKTQDTEHLPEAIDSLSLKSSLSMEIMTKSDPKFGLSTTQDVSTTSVESVTSLQKPIEEKLEKPIPKETWPELILGEQTTFLRNGPSCPDVYEKSRNVIDKNELPLPEPHLESAHLDYALIMNMLDGNWGTDEDQTIAQITFKYVHDEAFRKRLARECHSLIDECDCPLHDKITNEKLMNLNDSGFYEIETEEDKLNVVDRLRKEFRERYEDDMNMDMERVINPGPDSDEDDEYYVEGFKKDEIKVPEITDYQDPKGWLGLDEEDAEKCCDIAHSEEALLMRMGYPERSRIKINRLRMKDMVKVRDRKNIEKVVEQMYQDKVHQFRVDEFKGIKWKPKKVYAYKRPDWQRPNSKKRDSYVEQEENTEE